MHNLRTCFLTVVTAMLEHSWQYWDGDKYNNDDTLTLEFTALSPCQLVRVDGQVNVIFRQAFNFGDYRSIQ